MVVRLTTYSGSFILLLSLAPLLPYLSLNAQVPTTGLIAEWLFNGNAIDGSANNHNGTVYGATSVHDRFGVGNSAYSFDGMNDYIFVPHHSDLNLEGPFSISAWFRTCDRNDQGLIQQIIIGKPPTSSNAPELGYGLNAEFGVYAGRRDVHVVMRKIRPTYGYLVGTGFFSTQEWHHVAIVCDVNQNSYIYLDNQLYLWDTPHHTWSGNVEDVSIGGLPTSNFFQGQLDDIRIYDRALSVAEVGSLYGENGWDGEDAKPDLQLSFKAVGDTVICLGDSAQLSLITNADRIFWNTTSGLKNETTSTLVANPATTTTYTVTGIRYGDGACPDSTVRKQSITVKVVEPPVAHAGEASYRCIGDTVTLGGPTTGGTPPYQWEWRPDIDLDNIRKEQPELITRVPGTRRYFVTVTDALGCTSTDSVSVTVIPKPEFTLNFSGDTIDFCFGSKGVELSADVAGNPEFFRFTWRDVAGTVLSDSSSLLAAPSKLTLYHIEVSDETGLCSNFDTVWVNPVPAPTIDLGEDRVICRGDSLLIGPENSGSDWSYRWKEASGLRNPDLASTFVSPASTTTFELTVTDVATGCSVSDEVTVRVIDIDIRVEGEGVDGGTLDGCSSARELSIRLRNHGSETGRVKSIAGDVPGITLLDSDVLLPPGESVEARIRFTPPGAGTWNGTVGIIIGPCNDTLYVPFTAVKEQALISLAPVAFDFGSLPECEIGDVDTTITVVNNGTADARLLPSTLPNGYTIVAPTLPVDLPAGDSVDLVLRYGPTGPGTYAGTLELPYESGTCEDTLQVELRGSVEDVEVTAGSPRIDVGIVDGCEEGKDTTVVLHNRSDLPVTIGAADLPAGFTLLDQLPATIEADDSIHLRLRFAPGATGVISGIARFTYEPCGPEVTVEVTGEKRGISLMIPDMLDFGTVPICGDQFGEIAFGITLSTGGSGNGQITSFAVPLPFSTDIANGTILGDGEEQKILVRFTPTADGTFEEELVLQIEPCNLTRRIVLKGRAVTPLLSPRSLDFGTQPVGMARSGDVLFINEGEDSLTVGSLDRIAPPFTLLGSLPPLPARLGPGDTLRAMIEYVPIPGVSSSPLEATFSEPCEVTVATDIRGEGNTTARARIVVESMAAAPGANTGLILNLKDGEGVDIAGATRFVAEVAFEPSMLVVNDATPWRLANGMRIVEIQGERGPGELLARVELTATLGRAEETELLLHSFEWIDPVAPVSIDTIHGTFRLEGLCRDGGVRLFDPEGVIAIRGVAPNPTSGEMTVRYSLSEHGEHSMRILDANGREVLLLFSGPFVPGVYELQVPVDDLAAGRYWLTLQTPTLAVTEVVEVVK